jgi:hypothetical protein
MTQLILNCLDQLPNSFVGDFTEILFNGREPIKAAEIRYDDYDRNLKKVDCKIDV